MFTCSYCKRQCEGEPHKLRHPACGNCYTEIQAKILLTLAENKRHNAQQREEQRASMLATGLRPCLSCKAIKPLKAFLNGPNTWRHPCRVCISARHKAFVVRMHKRKSYIRTCKICGKNEHETPFYPSQASGRCKHCLDAYSRARRAKNVIPKRKLKADNGS